ncbi:MAG: hydantoinase/oxoprolinase family protein [Streptosporangiales bacterium]|nr:hydantoinase/oxoprolinase family protein [Streptosporangiales bacterium]
MRVGVDIGGTFTDVVAIDETGRRSLGKSLSTPREPETAVLRGLEEAVLGGGHSLSSITQIIHGTTLVSNALIERKGARTALLTTHGFRDQLEIGNEGRYDTYDLFLRRAEPLVPRCLRFGVPERVLADGTVAEPLDEAAVRELTSQLADHGVEALALSFLHSYRNSRHEEQAAAIVREALPHVAVSLSAEVDPQIREHQRASTAVANAYVQPFVERYLTNLARELRGRGIDAELLVMTSGGGLCGVETAIRFPVRVLESGPIGAVQAGVFHARGSGDPNLVVFDMGGTTAKVCLVDHARALTTSEFEIARSHRLKRGSGLPIRAPVVDMIEVGAGGGSIADVNSLGLVTVGPESAGADPGPACYGLGGSAPTVTDADLILGYLSPSRFLGGRMALDVDAAARAVGDSLAGPLDLEVVQAAWAVHQVVNEFMASALRVHAVERGKRVEDYSLFALGGAGPMHACHVAKTLGVNKVISPNGAGVASAFGFLCAPVSFASVRSYYEQLDQVDWNRARELLQEMELEGLKLLQEAGCPQRDAHVAYLCDMRYCGQAHEVTVPLRQGVLAETSAEDAVRLSFRESYEALFGEAPELPVECLNWRVVLTGPDPRIPPQNWKAAPAAPPPAEERSVYFPEGGFRDAPVFRRADLGSGVNLPGPAVVEEDQSTFVLPPGFDLEIDLTGNLIATRR